ncbi:MAG: WYL domain-containing transcriptional regulator [Spirochaetales bacterium]|nr:WYL domain-containing transcriptional regulator [Spirochaetales bacterium]
MYGKNLIKLFKAINLLTQPPGVTITQLQDQLNTSRRSVYRLLDTLKELHFPLYEEKDESSTGKKWQLDEQYLTKLPDMSLPDLRLTKEEIILLFFLFGRGTVFKKTKLEKYLFSLKSKLDVFLPDNLKSEQAIAKLDDIFIPYSPDLKDYSGKEDILDDLMDSIVQYKRCIVTYYSLAVNQDKYFQIDPLKLFEHESGLYVFVRVVKYSSISILSVERIKKFTVLESRFEYPAGFKPEEILESASFLSFGDPVTARIWFSKDQAQYIKDRQWDPSREIEDQPDGSIILSINASGVFDVKKWILSFGSSARILEPANFAREINEEIIKMLKNYTI